MLYKKFITLTVMSGKGSKEAQKKGGVSEACVIDFLVTEGSVGGKPRNW